MPYTNSPILLPDKTTETINRSPWSRIIEAQRSTTEPFNKASQRSCDKKVVS